ncbi:cytochrome P450 83B1-like [Chenopodium quinoa]|uniref:cytochrome P450 83B1-like n=1 Tax=Chenopodium quinoa TaxID=63459 RepID=UPI000B78118E|nr:cytochrome P450 83B1-like [Chenopodium quinoa]
MLLLFILMAALSVIFLAKVSKNGKNQPFCPPPGPKGLPLIGNLHQFEPSNTHVYYSKLGKTYGPIFALRLMSKPMVVIQSAKLAQEIFQTHDKNFCNRPMLAGTKKLSYNGLDVAFSPYSDYIREMKKILIVHLLNSKKVESFAPIRQEEVSRLIQEVSSLSSASKIVNLSQLVLSFASSTSGRIAFGKRYDDDSVLGRRYYSLLHEAEAMFTGFFYTDYVPFGGFLDMITGKSSKLEKTFKDLNALLEKIINEHLHKNKLESTKDDMVDVLLRLMNDTSFPYKLTMNHIKAILMNLFVGGANTTTAGVIWIIAELIKNPIPMKKVQEELRCVAQNKGCILEDDLPKLEYFKAVIKETIRLHPPAPLLVPHETVEKSVIEGYDILPNTMVIINAWVIGRDPKCWKDSKIFMPERFIGSSVELKGREMMPMYPFGGGRRMCPAYTFGLVNLELVLANLLYSFDWELPNGLNKEEIDSNVLPGIVMHKEKQLCLVAKKF